MSAKRYTKDQKSSWLEEFKQHRGSASAFCRDREIPYQSFCKWLRVSQKCEPNESDCGDSTQDKDFVEIEIPAHGLGRTQDTGGARVELSLGNGMVLRIFHTQVFQA